LRSVSAPPGVRWLMIECPQPKPIEIFAIYDELR
jgi:hypothetical protein